MKNIFLVDADETLLDFPYEERLGLLLAFEKNAVPFREEYYTAFHRINDLLWKALERQEITRERLVIKRFEILFEQFGISLDATAFCEDYFVTLRHGGRLYEGAEQFLAELCTRGEVYIVTNGSANVQHGRLMRSGIMKYAKGAFISEEVGVYKPSPDYAKFVEEHIEGYERARAVWIGDSLTSDCACARSRGIDFILYAPKGKPLGYDGAWAENYLDALRKIEQF